MLVGGYYKYTNDFLNDVEIVLLNNETACSKPHNYPRHLRGSYGTYAGGKPLVCGGRDSHFGETGDCYEYSFATDSWTWVGSTLGERAYSAGVMINDSTWWITGGMMGSPSRTTELYDVESQTSTSFVKLPAYTDGHTVIKLNETHYFLCCGEDMDRLTYFFDMTTMAWTRTNRTVYYHDDGYAGTVDKTIKVPSHIINFAYQNQ